MINRHEKLLSSSNLIVSLAIVVLAQSTAFCQASVTLTGKIRDFNAFNSTSTMVPGHPDFGRGITGVMNGPNSLVNSTLGPDGVPVFSGVSGGNIQDAASFNQWYRDVPGVNVSDDNPITLTGPTIDNLSYSNDSFFPIDGRLLGNDGNTRNYNFTLELTGSFTYHRGRNQKFYFRGDDDVWFFVNNKLVIDLGGVHPAAEMEVLMDDFEQTAQLADGQNFGYRFFFAERYPTQSQFSIRSSLGPTVPEPSTLYLALIGGISAITLKRNRQGHEIPQK